MTARARARAAATWALAAAVALALAGRAAHAHDPFEITADARLQPAALAVRITMASSTAARACPLGTTPGARIAAGAWPRARPRMESCARDLLRLTPPLAAGAARATLTEESDVDVELQYPRPAGGPLRIEAPFLAALDDPTYGVILRVSGDATLFGDKLLRADDPALEVQLPPPSTPHFPVLVLVLVAVSVLVLVWAATVAVRRRRR